MPKANTFDSSAYIEGMRSQLDRGTLPYSDWITKNFRHPKNDRLPWSFKDHEFQIEIMNQGDNVQEVSTEKAAQTGMSTITINWVLTFAATHDYSKIAYVLPTAKFATDFTALRMNPAIDASPAISNLVSDDTDNVGMKKIGSCFMVMRGTSGESQAISIDLDCLVVDEYSFCNQKILSTFSSRLQHSLLKLRRNFSTPTLPKFGISALYDESSRALRAVYCQRCNTWVFPDFYNDIVIPGFDKPMKLYRKGDHEHPGVPNAYLACPNCRKELTLENLNNPDLREWVHRHPDNDHKGYKVAFWDVPKYNPVPEVLIDIKNYSYQDYVNFRIGDANASEQNSFVAETIKRNAIIRPVSIDTLRSGGPNVRGVFIGADLGKTNHVAIGVPATDGGLDVICFCRVDVFALMAEYGEAAFGPWLKDLHIKTWSIRTILDHAPSWEPALYMHSQLPEGQAYGAYYVGEQKGKLDIYEFKNATGAVNISRDAHFDDVAGAVNSGKIRFPYLDDPEMGLVLKHLDVMKKARQINSKGQAIETWVSSSDEDHYAHALGYLWAAYSSVEERFSISSLIMPPSFGRVRLKG